MDRKIFAAAAFLAVVASPANSIPIAFDFTGTVRDRALVDLTAGSRTFDPSAVGQSFTARVVFETDLFTERSMPTRPTSRVLDIATPTSATAQWNSSLVIGGQSIELAIHDRNYGLVHLTDSLWPFTCTGGCRADNDVLAIATRSEHFGPLGLSEGRFFTLVGFEGVNFSSPLSPSYIDLDQPFDVASILTYALPNLSLSYSNSTSICEPAGVCSTRTQDQTRFNITSFTRTALSVPEPGTLGLVMAGLLAAGITRRRAKQSSPADSNIRTQSGHSARRAEWPFVFSER